jgi:hypothetical protein
MTIQFKNGRKGKIFVWRGEYYLEMRDTRNITKVDITKVRFPQPKAKEVKKRKLDI